VSIDARGHGESDWSPDGWYGFERYADDVRAVAAGFAAPVLPVLVGASLGGVASMLAIGASDEPITSGLILVDVAHRLNPDGQRRIGEFMLGNPEGFESLEQAADAVAAYIPHRPRPRDLSGLRKNLRQRDDGRWVWHWDPRFLSESTPFPTDGLVAAIARIADMELPTLLVRGRLSDIVDEEQARELQQLIPHARVVDVAGAGHMVAGDSNDLFNEAVLEFVDSVRKSDDAG
jgi:non-heme chloroperoxidase